MSLLQPRSALLDGPQGAIYSQFDPSYGISKLALIGLIDTIAWINNLFTELSSKMALRAIEAVRMRASGKGSQNGIKE